MEKAALVFIGEAFRGDGAMRSGQMCRTRGDPSSFPEQKLACETHMNFVRKLEHNWDVDVFIDTYDTQFNSEIISWYGPNLKAHKFHMGKAIGYLNIYKDSIDLIENLSQYSFVHFFRIDLFLKDRFISGFEFSDKIRYAFRQDAILWWLNTPRLTDTMLFVPNSSFKLLEDKVPLLDDIWVWGVILKFGLRNMVDVYVKTLHDSDPKKDWNPLYKFANRIESSDWTMDGHVLLGGLSKKPSLVLFTEFDKETPEVKYKAFEKFN
jgi:hypothetical protein